MKRKRDLPREHVFSFSRLPCVQETEDHAGGCHSVYLYQHALQGHGSQHPARHQGAAGAYAGCGPEVGQNGFTTMLKNSTNKVLPLPGVDFWAGFIQVAGFK